MECRVQAPAGVQPGDAVERRAADIGEFAGEQDFPIRLHRHTLHGVIGARAGIESKIETAIRIQPGNVRLRASSRSPARSARR